VRYKLDVRATECMTFSGTNVRERHSIAATGSCVHLMNLAGEPVRRNPLDHRVGIEE
jgi:hypothetical protein